MQLHQSAHTLSSSHLMNLLNDLDGASWVKDVMALVEDGSDYVHSTPTVEGTVETVRTAVDTLRQVLALDDVIVDLDLTPNRGDCLSIAGVAREDDRITAAFVENKSGRGAVIAQTYIDCTGDADLGRRGLFL